MIFHNITVIVVFLCCAHERLPSKTSYRPQIFELWC